MDTEQLFIKYTTLYCIAEKQIKELGEESPQLLPLFKELAVLENQLLEAGVSDGPSSLTRSRIMKRPSTRNKLRRAAQRLDNKKKRKLGQIKQLRKEGTPAGEQKGYPAPAYGKKNENYVIDEYLFTAETINEFEELITVINQMEPYPIKYDIEDIKYAVGLEMINIETFYKELKLPVPEEPDSFTTLMYMFKQDPEFVNKTFTKHAIAHGLIVDPIQGSLFDIIDGNDTNETTTTSDVATTTDIRKKRKVKKLKKQAVGMKNILMWSDNLDEEELQLLNFFEHYATALTTEDLTLSIFEEFMEDLTEDISCDLYEMEFPKESLVLLAKGALGLIHNYSKKLKAYLVTDIASGETFFKAPESIKKLLTTDGKKAVQALSESMLENVGEELVKAVENKKINNKEEYLEFIKLYGRTEANTPKDIFLFFVEKDVSRKVAEMVLDILAEYSPTTYPRDLDVFAAEQMQNTEFHNDKKAIEWVSKAVLLKTKKSVKVIKSLFGLKVFWTVVLSLYIFSKESGLMKNILSRFFPKNLIPKIFLPTNIEKQLKISDKTIEDFKTKILGSIGTNKFLKEAQAYVVSFSINEMEELNLVIEDDVARQLQSLAKQQGKVKKDIKQLSKKVKNYSTYKNKEDFAQAIADITKGEESRGRKLGKVYISDFDKLQLSDATIKVLYQELAGKKAGFFDSKGLINTNKPEDIQLDKVKSAVTSTLQNKGISSEDAELIRKNKATYEKLTQLTLQAAAKAREFDEKQPIEKVEAILGAMLHGHNKDEQAARLGLNTATYTHYRQMLLPQVGKPGRKKVTQTNSMAITVDAFDDFGEATIRLIKAFKLKPLLSATGTAFAAYATITGKLGKDPEGSLKIDSLGNLDPKATNKTSITPQRMYLTISLVLSTIAMLVAAARPLTKMPAAVLNWKQKGEWALKVIKENMPGGDINSVILQDKLKNKENVPQWILDLFFPKGSQEVKLYRLENDKGVLKAFADEKQIQLKAQQIEQMSTWLNKINPASWGFLKKSR